MINDDKPMTATECMGRMKEHDRRCALVDKIIAKWQEEAKETAMEIMIDKALDILKDHGIVKPAILICAMLMLSACAVDRSALDGVRIMRTQKFLSAEAAAGPFTVPGRDFKTLQQVNAFVNAVPYRSEAKDVWKAPADFMVQGGDCEDFALAKYWMAQAYGLAKPEDMDLTLVYDRIKKTPHMVLVVGDLVLDNQSPDILPLSQVTGRYRMLGIVNHGSVL